MKTTKLILNILIVLLIMVGLWLGYRFFFGSKPESPPAVFVSSGAGLTGDSLIQANQSSEFVALLARLRNITLDAGFLANPVFISGLTNFSTSLPPRPYGRSNPFAVFGSNNVNRGVTAGSDQISSSGQETETPNTFSNPAADTSEPDQGGILDFLRNEQ